MSIEADKFADEAEGRWILKLWQARRDMSYKGEGSCEIDGRFYTWEEIIKELKSRGQ